MQEGIFDFWKFLAGIGLFLWGMYQLENSIKEIAGKSFRKLLQKSTNTPLKGISVGALITSVLQSSSVVTLMVLAFLGAGVLNLRNAIGVVMGANLGTTITGWIVATLGFKLSVAALSMPFIGLGSLVFLFFAGRPILKNIGAFSVGFGLMFLGLDFMKTAIEAVADQIDLAAFSEFGLIGFLFVGIIVTALIQSSSAMVVIVLSAMNADVIGLLEGAAIVIGAKVGTTITVGIGALNGQADKKRLALAHFLFNVITGLIIFSFIHPMIEATMWLFTVREPLIELVLFNTVINIIGIVLFFPFINKMEHWLKSRFKNSEPVGVSTYIKNVSTKVPEAALAALEKEIELAFEMTVDFIGKACNKGGNKKKNISIWKKIIQQPFDLLTDYTRLKSLEDELTAYHISLQEENLPEQDANKLTSLMLALRTMVFSAKDIKDVLHNLKEIEDSEDQVVMELYQNLKMYTLGFLGKLRKHIQKEVVSDSIPTWIESNANQYQNLIDILYQNVRTKQSAIPISTLTNVIKQVFSSLDNLANAVVYWKHQETQALDSSG